jgi:predicted cupin superfamily sugar epimerase
MHDGARRTIGELGLVPHPEGGYFRETYRSPQSIVTPRGGRAALTCIYFLLTSEAFSAFHRIASDEAWHFYRGDPLAIEILHPDGTHERRELSETGDRQTVVPAGAAFASHVETPGGYALVGCDVAPGFDFADFELCDRPTLLRNHANQAALIQKLTRENPPFA